MSMLELRCDLCTSPWGVDPCTDNQGNKFLCCGSCYARVVYPNRLDNVHEFLKSHYGRVRKEQAMAHDKGV